MKIKSYFLILFTPVFVLCQPLCPFISETGIGQVFAGNQGVFLHTGTDFHSNEVFPVQAVEGGRVWVKQENIKHLGSRDKDFVVCIGHWCYGNLEESTTRHLRLGQKIEAGEYVGTVGNWYDYPIHLHLEYIVDLAKSLSDRECLNPLPILETKRYNCEEELNEIVTGEIGNIFLLALDTCSYFGYNGPYMVLRGNFSLSAQVILQNEFNEQIAPYMIKWGINSTTIGAFTFNGKIPGVTRTNTYNENLLRRITRGDYWQISYMTGTDKDALHRNFNSQLGGHWNTLQSSNTNELWYYEVPYPCSLDTRKFPDGPYKLWVWARTYCGTEVADTVEVIIDNAPPQVVNQFPAKGQAIGDDRKVTFEFSEAIDSNTILANMNITTLCAGKKVVLSAEDITFSDGNKKLTVTIPADYDINDAFYFTLTEGITDFAGTGLDGNKDCVSGEDYDTWVGVNRCTPVFVGQTGGSTDWEIIDYYEEYEAQHPCFYKDYEFNGFFAGAANTTLKPPYRKAKPTQIHFNGVAVTPPWGRFIHIIVKDTTGATRDTLWAGVDNPKGKQYLDEGGRRIEWNYTWDYDPGDYPGYIEVSIRKPDGRHATGRAGVGYLKEKVLEIYRVSKGCGGDVVMHFCGGGFEHLQELRYEDHLLENVLADLYRAKYNQVPISLLSINGHTEPEVDLPGYKDDIGCEEIYRCPSGRYSGYEFGLEVFEFLCATGCIGFDTYDCAPWYPDGVVSPGNWRYEHPLARGYTLANATAKFEYDWGGDRERALALGAPLTFTVSDDGSAPAKVLPTLDDDEHTKEPDLPKEYALGKPRPNPFNTAVSFDIDLPKTSVVELKIYDILGTLVDIPIEGTEIPAGRFTETWRCESCPSGTYFAVLLTNNFHQTRKMMLVK